LTLDRCTLLKFAMRPAPLAFESDGQKYIGSGSFTKEGFAVPVSCQFFVMSYRSATVWFSM
jgi:hypothetical protein